MKKKTIWTIAVIMGLSFILLLFLQLTYIREMANMKKEQFDESVNRALYQASLPRKSSTTSTERRTGSVALPTGQRMVITMRAMPTSPMRIWLSTAYAMARFLESTP